jgi:hypothetical protein
MCLHFPPWPGPPGGRGRRSKAASDRVHPSPCHSFSYRNLGHGCEQLRTLPTPHTGLMAETTEQQRERRRERQKRWYAAHRARKIKAVQQWKDDNPERVLASARRRRERLDDERLRAWYRERYPSKTPADRAACRGVQGGRDQAEPPLVMTITDDLIEEVVSDPPTPGEYPLAPVASRASTLAHPAPGARGIATFAKGW